jgi:hypothetical protein
MLKINIVRHLAIPNVLLNIHNSLITGAHARALIYNSLYALSFAYYLNLNNRLPLCSFAAALSACTALCFIGLIRFRQGFPAHS